MRLVLTIFAGLTSGGVYAMVGAGLVLIFGVVRIPLVAHGATVIVGAYTAWRLSDAGVPYVLAIALGAVAGGLFGLFMALVVFDRLRGGEGSQRAALVASLGIIFAVEAILTERFGTQPIAITSSVHGSFTVGSTYFPKTQVVIIVAGVILVLGLELFVRRARWGRAMRAMALDRYAASLLGIPEHFLSVVAIVGGSLLAGAAGGLLASAYPVTPTDGATLSFDAFTVIIISGIGSVSGALAGGMILGLANAFFAGYVSSGYSDALTFALLLLVLVVRPEGIFRTRIMRD
jgi:branched-chain amino acid transport system permease protein